MAIAWLGQAGSVTWPNRYCHLGESVTEVMPAVPEGGPKISPAENSPEISVVIPVYNGAAYIAAAIDSVLAQQGCGVELIVVDDGSGDGTAEAIAPYQSQVIYLYQPNQGVSVARNLGIRQAQGEFVAFLDADDYFLPGKLAAQLALFRRQPWLGLVHSGWRRVDAQDQALAEITPWEKYPVLDLVTWLQYKPVLPSAMVFRRDWLVRLGGFDPQLTAAEDVDLVFRLAIAGCQSAWLPQVTVAYRQHGQSAMGKGLVQADCLRRLLDKTFQNPQLPIEGQLLERQIRYGTLTWAAWYLLRTAHPEAMVETLRQAFAYSHRLPLGTLMHWIESFVAFSRDWDEDLNVDEFVVSAAWQSIATWVLNQAKTTQAPARAWVEGQLL